MRKINPPLMRILFVLQTQAQAQIKKLGHLF